MLRAGPPELVAGLVSSLVKAIRDHRRSTRRFTHNRNRYRHVCLGLSAILAFIIGFGLHGTWANMAAGIWLTMIRPFDKGDFIEVAGFSDIIEEISIMST